MNNYFIKETGFKPFLKKMMGATKVIGPVAKKTKFIYQELEDPEELRLDFDVTLKPAKEAFFPTRQNLIKFDGDKVESCIDPKDQVLFGVHFYEIKAIDMLDNIFKLGNEDRNYLANREHTTIVGSNIQNISPRAFWATVSVNLKPTGHDAFLTKISGGYLFEARTDKGEKLVGYGDFLKATDKQVKEAKKVNDGVMKKCKEKLPADEDVISKKVRNAFKNKELWNELAKDCFSCGTCNIVCPTCYCFDVQDTWGLDQKSGVRCRSWDGCLLEDFSKVSLGGGHQENFRDQRGDRFRHRIMRKTTYLNEKLGSAACVGCGRCSVGCVPDIADPVKVVETIMKKA